MAGVRFIFGLHIHQPVGNFESVFECTYNASYEPFLEVAEHYPEVPFVLHISGPLLDWLTERRPDYVGRVRALVERGRVELLGGPYHEPILPNIPERDRVGQIAAYSARLEGLFGQKPRGMWLPERVWEQSLVTSLADAGITYTVLDDFHFGRAGIDADTLRGTYLTEDQGRLIALFPNSESLRYLIPWKEPHETYLYLRRIAERDPGAVLVCADDGEKFGGWPNTYDHVYKQGWLRRFFDMLRANRDWIECVTFARAMDTTLPLGKIYIPDASYREMTEWALPTERYRELAAARKELAGAASAQPLLRWAAGGNWRNFRTKYSESDEMYARMLNVSNRVAEAGAGVAADADALERARMNLYRAQCNCPYWHGAFGGLYLPHLRSAIYQRLIEADLELDRVEGVTGPRVDAVVADWNLDLRQEVRLESEHLSAFVRPATGGHLYELDVRAARLNLLATLERRPEPYHDVILASAGGSTVVDTPPSVQQQPIFKHADLDDLLVYDRHPRKAFVDHVLPLDVTLDDLAACRDIERGDFVTGAYLGRVEREADRVRLVLERRGLADGHLIQVCKTFTLFRDLPAFEVHYELRDLPALTPIHFGVELNVAGLAGNAPDRTFRLLDQTPLGTLSTPLELADLGGLQLVDEWMPLQIELSWSRAASLWAFPVRTVSQSEGGFEGVYQSSALLPHWVVRGDERGAWDVSVRWHVHQSISPVKSTVRPQRSSVRSSASLDVHRS